MDVFYFPFSRSVRAIRKNELENKAVHGACDQEIRERERTQLNVFLTTECNLRCAYCYARGGETAERIDPSFVKAGIGLFSKEESPMVYFHGGGEQTLAFGELEACYNYGKKSLNDPSFGILTNGVFSRETGLWLCINMDTINISCDGPPDIQDRQRPMADGGKSSEHVEATMRLLNERSKEFGVRATITSRSTGRQAEIVEYLAGCGATRAIFEPMIPVGRGYGKAGTIVPDKESCASNFLEAVERAEELGIELSSSILPFGGPKKSFCSACGRKFALTTDGHVSACSEVVCNDLKNPDFIIGRYEPASGTILLDQAKIEALKRRTSENIPMCRDCFLKWDCAGNCLIRMYRRTGDIYMPDVAECELVRRTFREYVFRKLDRKLYPRCKEAATPAGCDEKEGCIYQLRGVCGLKAGRCRKDKNDIQHNLPV